MSSNRTIGWILIAVAALIAAVGVAILCLRSCDAEQGVYGLQDEEGDVSVSIGDTPKMGEDAFLSKVSGLYEKAVEDVEAALKAQAEATQVQSGAAANASAVPPLNMTSDLRSSFVHGDKPAQYQKYIVLHDTEGSGSAQSVINWWDSNGKGVAAHFVINKDGSIVQCVDMDKITHHAGYGDTGHNASFGVAEDGRDDMVGTVSIGSWASDYGMNSYSIGIELVHVGGEGDYPEAQLQALDSLIAYIDSYYGFESAIIDHKDWRSGNSDTSPEFLKYFQNYKSHRKHSAS